MVDWVKSNAEFWNTTAVWSVSIVLSYAGITTESPLSVEQTLSSSNGIYELGFFSPNNSQNQYVGIWFKGITPRVVVWVANRETPTTDTSANLAISSNGSLLLFNGKHGVVWSIGEIFASNGSRAELTDNGNLVVIDNVSGRTLWESFEHFGDTMLPFSSLMYNLATGEKRVLTSWKTDTDPSPGVFVGQITPQVPSQVLIMRGSTRYYRTGPWAKTRFTGIPLMDDTYASPFSLQQDANGSGFFTYFDRSFKLSRIIISSEGSMKRFRHNGTDWELSYMAPANSCDIYGVCGPFGLCTVSVPLKCKCFKGFVPHSTEEWKRGNWTGGCARRTELHCQGNSTGKDVNIFHPVANVKLPDFYEYESSVDAEECHQSCLHNCSCLAFAYIHGIGCLIWNQNLMDAVQFSAGGEILSIRLAHSELGGNERNKIIVASIVSLSLFVILTSAAFGFWRYRVKHKAYTLKDAWRKDLKSKEVPGLEFFEMNTIQTATNNFSLSNKLGQGGFGSVYKGKLQDGKKIAVKRLSSSSGQGKEEFMNEIVLISKLQHRNLVRVLGCCIEGEEKLLIYEFMLNKSLDTFVFGGGYMSPEYAWTGVFSEKSDIYSFGVLVLEIISGEKISRFSYGEEGKTLLAYAWECWCETKGIDLLDQDLGDSCLPLEVGRCVQIGLLCVQHQPADRPNTLELLSMLTTTSDLPSPLQPTFVMHSRNDESSLSKDLFTINEMTQSMILGRITRESPLSIGKTLSSSNGVYELGFFSFNNSQNQYVGIWFKGIIPRVVVWVANREKPVTDSAANLTISSNGSLLLFNGKHGVVWSIGEIFASNGSRAELTDNGNFVVIDNASGRTLWESFEHFGNTMLPFSNLMYNLATGEKRVLTSWKSHTDPSPGDFTVQITPQVPSQACTMRGSKTYWRSGPWAKTRFTGIPVMDDTYTSPFSLQQDTNGSGSFTYFERNFKLSYIMITSEGSLEIFQHNGMDWELNFEAPENSCDIYGFCGPFGICVMSVPPKCKCFKGFVPKSIEEWKRGNWTDGCVRHTELHCQGNTNGKTVNGFYHVANIKPPDFYEFASFVDAEGCYQICLNNCSCLAFAYINGIGCLMWNQDLMDAVQFSAGGEILSIRLASSELGGNKRNKIIVASIVSLSLFVILAFVAFCFLKYKVKHNVSAKISKIASKEAWNNDIEPQDVSGLKFFEMNTIQTATDNFSLSNKLGQGGFGSVYKGNLQDGKEIAVKRLSSSSGQGKEEFMNEIVLISKLQHKNLVQILGCCIEGEERLLVYEFLLNKSLDTFLFGYMAPEYAWTGMFSEKSDIYSFGVILLEIITGEKISRFSYGRQGKTLLAYAWESWCESGGIDLLDKDVADSCHPLEVERCVQIGLLCVQHQPADRPNTMELLSMLTTTSDLTSPKQPTFVVHTRDEESLSQGLITVNEMTQSVILGQQVDQDLMDRVQFSPGGEIISIRLARSELDANERNMIITASIVSFALFVIMASAAFGFWRYKAKISKDASQVAWRNDLKPQDGKLQDGKEIAVKRLSSSSRQGNEEFMNEIIGLLCVQHQPAERPNTLELLSMLTTTSDLPPPKQPTFVVNTVVDESPSKRLITVNEMTHSMILGR
ncbi:unnamed protein product [Arabidopsis thaliana]|uniref:(thale cress) hypothetical protein n=1 Tax=Arabidopsis thaliana TaxID=3702 RepID=A0A7G2E5R0_ARATH|nr:unnamed protein product [Arabidopsis thaliana]